jgi:hypothetical protein
MDKIPFNPYDFFGYLASGLLIVVGMQKVAGFPEVLGHDFKIVDGAVLLLAVYIAGQLMATPAKAFFEDGIVDKLLKRPSTNLFEHKKRRLRFVFPGFYKPFPEHIRNKVLKKAEDEGVKVTGESLFLHVRFSESVRNDEKLMSRLNSFLNQYGFNRNLAFTSLVVGVALLAKARFGAEPELTKYGITAVVAGILLFYRYLKFFRQYSYELFNSYGGN